MPDDRRHLQPGPEPDGDPLDDPLNRFWNELVRPTGDLDAAAAALDPHLAETLRRLHALTKAPPPATARARLHRGLRDSLGIPPDTLEDHMHATVPLTLPGARVAPNGHTRAAPAPLAKPRGAARRPPTRWLIAQAATAAILLLTLVLGYFAYRGGQEHRAALPPAQGTATPIATPGDAWTVPFAGNPAGTREAAGPGPRTGGAVAWQYPAEGASGVTVGSSMVVAGGVLYANSRVGDAGLVAVDLATGAERWRTSEAGGRPVIDGDGLIARTNAPDANGGFDLVRVRASDGSIVWRAEQGKIGDAWAANVADGVGYVPSGTELIAFDPATGERRWAAPLDAPASRGPIVGEGLVVVGDVHGKVYAFGLDGTPRWTFQAEVGAGDATVANISVRDGRVFASAFTDQTGTYTAFDAATGKPLWALPPLSGGHYFGGAIGTDAAFVTATNGSLQAVDLASGQPRWTTSPAGGVSNAPTLAGDLLYHGTDNGALAAVDAATGAELWRVPVVGQGDCVPVVLDGEVYLSSSIGTLYAIAEAPAGAATPAPETPTAAASTGTGANLPAVATFAWASSGGDQPFGPFVAPSAIDRKGNLWVADSTHSRFQIFAPDGTFLEAWGEFGTSDGQFDFRRANSGNDAFGDVAFAPDGSFYVADTGNVRIQHFAADRTFLAAWGAAGTGKGQFLSPNDVEVDAEGNVFVNDDKRADVQKFAPDGTLLLEFGGFGSGPGQLNYQGFMALDREGNVYVADAANGRVEIWDNDGRFLAQWSTNGVLEAPVDVAVDDAGRVYLSEAGSGEERIVVLDRFGNPIGVVATAGGGDGQFNVAQGLVLDGQGNLYAGDIFGPVIRIQKLVLTS